ncbi:MAG TPA: family 16 glycosylhydrolase [Victivallales bacterium]|nr:family 16 glycosylhydrolase [Victivallales bacterium]
MNVKIKKNILFVFILFFLVFTSFSEILITTDFSKGDFNTLGWKAEEGWDIYDYKAKSANPGPVARFFAPGKKGLLSKTFNEINNPGVLFLSLDLGWGTGAATQGTDFVEFLLLNSKGDGYIFHIGRNKGKSSVQWAVVNGRNIPDQKSWAPEPIDGSLLSVTDGGGLLTLKIVRGAGGSWVISSKNWNKGKGGVVKFNDNKVSSFSELSIVGGGSPSEQVFNNIHLEVKPPLGIKVEEPSYCSEIKGDTQIKISVPGYSGLNVVAKCWQQGPGQGKDSIVANVSLDNDGKGSFIFPADKYPHGPITLRLSCTEGELKDNCYLQLYNKGGISWNEGIPSEPPPPAKGMKLIFQDDFKDPLSIGDGPDFKYYDHKPPHGWQDFSTLRFTSFSEPNNPFAQMDSYLRIRASEKAKSAGLISSLRNDGTGVKVSIPCYFECRFIAPNAIGSWPAFWLMTDYMSEPKAPGCDELDIIEAYGGEGPGHPNAYDSYMITAHAWPKEDAARQPAAVQANKDINSPIRMGKFGIKSAWYETFHIYGCKITETDTIYYCDNIEVARHKTLEFCKKYPIFFMVNLATGGGWPVDLSRYDGVIDMYIDYIRVYSAEKK